MRAMHAGSSGSRKSTVPEMAELRRDVPRLALKSLFRGKPLQELAKRVVHLAHQGLARRRKLDRMGGDESHFINTLDRIADSGITPAEEKIGLFNGRWGKSVDPVFSEFAY